MIVLRILGLAFVLAALAAVVGDATHYVDSGTWQSMPLGVVWAWLHTPSLGLLEAAVVRHVSEDLWYDWIFPVLEAPAWLVFAAPGLVLLAASLLFRGRGRRRSRFRA